MNQKLKQLLELQSKDIVVDMIAEELEGLPLEIEEVKKIIAEEKRKFDDYKKENNQKLLSKKQKEGELEKKEAEISKHNQELNAIKTNEAYRAILKEIEKVKSDKSLLEEEILQLMEDLDNFGKEVKKTEAALKVFEAEKTAKINILEEKMKSLESEKQLKEQERNEFVKTVGEDSLQRYNYIRNAKKGSALVLLEGETCGGCRMRVPPHVITQILKGGDLVVCEVCSRILYSEKSVETAENAKQ